MVRSASELRAPLNCGVRHNVNRLVAQIMPFLATVALAACTTTPSDSSSVLRQLADSFRAARRLPLGSRPAPPAVDLGSLVGQPVAIVREAIGHPDPTARYPQSDCGARRCISFTYGPAPEPPQLTRCDQQLCEVVVTTGGPWLLLLGSDNGIVASAQWRGQK
jgi:hypothetical protein